MADNKLSRVARIDDGFLNEDDPLAELARIVGQSAPVEKAPTSMAARREPEFDLEEELLREFEKFDAPFRDAARSVMNAPKSTEVAASASDVEISTHAPHAPETMRYAETVQSTVAHQPASPVAEPEEPEIVFSAPTFDFSDFELEDASQQDAMDDPIFSELANVASTAHHQTETSRGTVAKAPVQPASAYAEWKTDRLESMPATLASPMPSMRIEPPLFEDETLENALQAELPAAPPVQARTFSGAPSDDRMIERRSTPAIGDMLADAERYPIVGSGVAPARPSLATPTLPSNAAEVKVSSSIFDEPLKYAGAVAPTKSPVVDISEAPDPFDNSDFSIDFDSIELELSDLAQVAPSVSHVGSDSRSGWENSDTETSSALHFDPSQISETEDHLETISDLEVPSLPVIEKDDHVAATPDYFMEIDAEMGSLFEETMDERARAASSDPWTELTPFGANASATAANSDHHMNDFQRELEEDFRKSLLDSQSRDTTKRQSTGRRRGEDLDALDAKPVYQPPRQSNRFGMVLATAFAGVIVLGGLGYYLWNHTSLNTVTASGEPRIILADKEPAKVVPEDKGGQSVPNQDKAVYDKVAGANTEDPKQKTLISSSEDPVDVVQKTLAPEAGSEAPVPPSVTETTDTQDNRLLPNAAQASPAENVAAVQQPTIAPRKVKTMIVRSDGTLVQRDDGQMSGASATPVTKPVETASSTPAVKGDPSTKPLTADATTMASKTGSTDKTVSALAQTTATTAPVKQAAPAVPLPPATNGGKNDTRLTAAGETKTGNTDAKNGSPNSDVAVTVPAHKVKTTTTGKAPVPSTRPADQPVNVVGTVTENGKVVPVDTTQKPAKQVVAPAAQQPVQVASAEPAAQPAASGGGFGMQVASFPSEEEAKKAFAGLKNKYGGFLAGQGLEIRKAEIAGIGTRYRVRVPVGSKDEAAALCVKYRAAGGSCLVSK